MPSSSRLAIVIGAGAGIEVQSLKIVHPSAEGRAARLAQNSTTIPTENNDRKFHAFVSLCVTELEKIPDRGDLKRVDVWKIFHFRHWDPPSAIQNTFQFLKSTMQREVKRHRMGGTHTTQNNPPHVVTSRATLTINLWALAC